MGDLAVGGETVRYWTSRPSKFVTGRRRRAFGDQQRTSFVVPTKKKKSAKHSLLTSMLLMQEVSGNTHLIGTECKLNKFSYMVVIEITYISGYTC